MKSTIRIELRKPQSTRHVCPVGGRPVYFNLEYIGRTRTVLGPLNHWLNRLWSDSLRDGSDSSCWTGSHHAVLTARVSGLDGAEHELIVAGHLTCSAISLLTRSIARFERDVYRRHLLEQELARASSSSEVSSEDKWLLLPYGWCGNESSEGA